MMEPRTTIAIPGLVRIKSDPFSMAEWIEAARLAPTIKNGFYTILSSRDCVDEIRSMLESDVALSGCFIA